MNTSGYCKTPRCHTKNHWTECTQPQCPGCIPARTTHGNLCNHHYNLLTTLLSPNAHSIEETYEWLLHNLGQHLHTTNTNPPITGTRTPQTPLNLTAHDLADTITTTIAAWANLLHQHLHTNHPTHNIYENLATLTRHIDTITTLDWCPDMLDELHHLNNQALTAFPIDDHPRHCDGIPCRTCNLPDLWIDPGDENVTCHTCTATYTPSQYRGWIKSLWNTWNQDNKQ